ncbi:MAG: peptidoglycan bridge formation glycyltransferase FemA/FemB family protein, partial [Candidatus Paceibacterota bacterium]
MQIVPTQTTDKVAWNSFIKENYPPVGAFMQTWEWGDFKKDWGKKIERFFVTDGDQLIAAFMLAEHSLPFGFSYGYLPRGPVLA